MKVIKNFISKLFSKKEAEPVVLITPEMEQMFLYDLKMHYKRFRNAMYAVLKRADYLKVNKDEINKRIKIHDKSKSTPEEKEGWVFLSYKKESPMYEGNNPYIERKIEEALKLHKSRNRHHIEYWTQNGRKVSDMNDTDVVEMICDLKADYKEQGMMRDIVRALKDDYPFTKRQVWLINAVTDIVDPIKVSLK